MASHTVTIRDMSDAERERVLASGRMTPDHWAWVLVPTISASFLGWLIGVLVSKVVGPSSFTPTLPTILGALLGCFGAYGSLVMYRLFSRARSESVRDAQGSAVEMVEVHEAAVVQQEEYNDEGPIYYFDIGEEKVLFLWGQWMYDPHVFWHDGRSFAEEQGSGEPDDIPEGLPDPPFPNSHFIIHRTKSLGKVIRIDLLGDRISPQTTIPVSAVALSDLPPSCILSGSLRDLASAVAGGRATSA